MLSISVATQSVCNPKSDLSCVVHSSGAEYSVCSDPLANSYLSQNSGDAPCEAPDLYAAGKQAIRREVRSLSEDQWQRVVNAIWVTRTLTFAEGVAKYGALFKTYDYLVLRHVVMEGPSNSQFGPFHGAQVRELEAVLQTIDPQIEGMPYWDYAVTSPTIFSDYYMGSTPADGAWHALTDGKFAYFPVANLSDVNLTEVNEYKNKIYPSIDPSELKMFDSRQFNNQRLRTFVPEDTLNISGGVEYAQRSMKTHTVNRDPTGAENSGSDAVAACSADGNVVGTVKEFDACLFTGGSMDMWSHCTQGEQTYGLCGSPQLTSASLHGDGHACLLGDMGGQAYAAADPLYFFLHANVERQRMTWMYYNKHRAAAYYDYPNVAFGYDDLDAKMGAYETNLGFTWRQIGFTRETLGFDFYPGDEHELLSHADMLCWAGPHSAPFTYDTLKALMDRDVLVELMDGTADSWWGTLVLLLIGTSVVALVAWFNVRAVFAPGTRRAKEVRLCDNGPDLAGYDLGSNDAANAAASPARPDC